MRVIDKIIIHCTATKAGIDYHVSDIDRWHRDNGWKRCGYHFVVTIDGLIEVGRPIEMIGAHCLGQNKTSIGIAYVGGVNAKGVNDDTRTSQQRVALETLVKALTEKYHCKTYGHRDFSPKDCPCFDAAAEYAHFYQDFLDRQASEVEDVFG